MYRYRRFPMLVVSLCFGLLLFTPSVVARATSASISHAYQASGQIPNGSLVSLDTTKSNYVNLATTDNGSQLIGVAVAANESLLSVDATSSGVQVATSGVDTALVSTVNGPIAVGDQISVSPFAGVGEKALPGSHVVGLAQSSFSASTSGAKQQTVTDASGHNQQISVGYVRVNIAVGVAASQETQKLSGLQKLGKSLTGHEVSTARMVVSLVVAAVALVALVTLVYTSIYSGIISIGRNPLAKYAVIRTITAVLAMALAMAVIAMITILLLLR